MLKDKDGIEGGRTTLCKVLKSIGFKYKAREDGKRYIYEQPRIIQQRHNYLRRMTKNRIEGRPQVYLDETWINSHAARERVWVNGDGSGGWKWPSGKGERLIIIIHAGSKFGWINHCGKWFKSKTKSSDNAKYHNTVVEKTPTKSSTKDVMRQWLTNHGIAFNPKDLIS